MVPHRVATRMDEHQDTEAPERPASNRSKLQKKLTRPRSGRMMAGVCAGIGQQFDMDPTLVRVIWVVATCFAGAGLLAYLVCWVVIPEE